MEIEDTTNPTDNADTVVIDETTGSEGAGVDDGDTEAQFDDDGNPIEGPEEDEEVEIDPDFKIKVKKAEAEKLRLATMRQADYTRKTQDLADKGRQVGETLQQLQTMNNQEFTARATLMTVDQQLAQYQNVDFQAAMNQAAANYDEDAKANIQAAFMKFTQLKDLRGQALGVIGQAQNARQSFEQQEIAKLMDHGRAELKKHVPDWSDDHKAKLVQFAAGFGVSAADLSDIETTPGAARILDAAFRAAGSAAKQKTADRAVAGQKTTPVATVKGTSARLPVSAATKDFAAFEKLANR